MITLQLITLIHGGFSQCKTVYTYTGSNQSYRVPEGATSITVKMWGAGGGEGGGGGNMNGGGGAYITGTLAVTPGETFTVIVGQGGVRASNSQASYGGGGQSSGGGTANRGGAGGGRSGLKRNSTGIEIAIAGGGGGGGSGYNRPGGGGGSLASAGGAGSNSGCSINGGQANGSGGCASWGGCGGSYNNNGQSGGSGQNATNSGGGGGGGYGGGAGGCGGGNDCGGGGGGSSYMAGFTSTSSAAGSSASQTGYVAAGNWADGDNVNAYGGGSDNNSAGQNGEIVITANLSSAGTLSGNQTICSQATTTFSSTVSGGTWSSANTAIATVDANTGVITGKAAGTVAITYTISPAAPCNGSSGCSSSGTCSASASRNVTVVNWAGSDGAITAAPSPSCETYGITISPSGGSGTPYFWGSNNGIASWNLFAQQAANSGSNYVYSAQTAGTYNFHARWADANGCFCWNHPNANANCGSGGNAAVTVNSSASTVGTVTASAPGYTSSTSTMDICAGTQITFTRTGSTGNATGWIASSCGAGCWNYWNTCNACMAITGNGTSSFTFSTAGTYLVRFHPYNAANSCYNYNSYQDIAVTVRTQPTMGTITINGSTSGDVEICAGSTLAVSQSGFNNQGGTTYFYSGTTSGSGVYTGNWEWMNYGNITAANQVGGQTGVNNAASFNYKINNTGWQILHTNCNIGGCYGVGLNRYIKVVQQSDATPGTINLVSGTQSGSSITVCPNASITATKSGATGNGKWWVGDATNVLEDWDYYNGSVLGNSFTYTQTGAPGVYQFTSYAHNDCGVDYTRYASASAIVAPVDAKAISSSQTICDGSTPSGFSGGTPDNGAGTYTYQWQQSADNGVTWSDINGATSSTYTPSALNASLLYKRQVTSAGCVTTEGELVSWAWNSANAWVTGSSIKKTNTVPDGWDVGAISTQSITGNGGYVEATMEHTNRAQMIGLSDNNQVASYTSIQFAAYPVNGNFSVFESGVFKGTYGTFAIGDRIRVAVENNQVKYYVNGNLRYTSKATPFFPLYADVALYSGNTNGGYGYCAGFKYVRIFNPVKISVKAVPVIPAITGNQTICGGGTTQFSVPFTNPTGGSSITTSGGYRIHQFTANDNFVTAQPLDLEVLVVGGGGGGGSNIGGGGGGGGVVYKTSHPVTANTYAVVVGSGGASNTNGSASSFNSIIGAGGGKGGLFPDVNGGDGGSGGGAGGSNATPNVFPFLTGGTSSGNSLGSGGSGTIYGGKGGALVDWRNALTNTSGAGGGGAGANALDVTSSGTTDNRNGGKGVQLNITGTSYYYAAGGGAGTYSGITGGNGGLGGGGGGASNGGAGGAAGTGGSANGVNGGSGANTAGGKGADNTGSGGGGGTYSGGAGGQGGTGIVIIRYPIITAGTWSSDNTAIAAVSPSGLVTASSVNSGTTTIRYSVTLNGCTTEVNRAVTVINAGVASTGNLTQPADICGTATTSVSIGSTTNATAPGNATLNLAWYYTPPSGGAPQLLIGQTGQTLNGVSLALNQTGNWVFERRATTDCSNTPQTASITLKVVNNSAATAGTLAQPGNVCGINTTTVSIASAVNASAPGNATLNITWYYTPPSGGPAQLLVGQTGQALSGATLALNQAGDWIFERRASTDCNTATQTATVILKVIDNGNALPGSLSQPSDVCGTNNTSVSIGSNGNASAPGNATLNLAWYYTPPSGGTAQLLSGQTGQTLNGVTLALNQAGDWLFERRATTDCNNTPQTASITLKVVNNSAATAGTLAQPGNVCGINTTTVSIASAVNASAPGNATLNITWYYTPPSGGPAQLLVGQTGQALSGATLALNQAGDWSFERRASTDCNNTPQTASITLKVVNNSAATAGTLAQPGNVCGINTTTVSIASAVNASAPGNATLNLTWYFVTPSGGTAQLLTGQTGQSLSGASLALNQTGDWIFERRATTDCNANIQTATITLHVINSGAANAGTLTQPADICGISTTTVSIGSTLNASATGNANLNISWYYTPPGGIATQLTGQTGQTLNNVPLNLNQTGNWVFERRATSDCNGSPQTAQVTFAVKPIPAGTVSSFSNPTTCSGTDGTIILSGFNATTTYSVIYNRNSFSQGPFNIATNGSGSLTIQNLNAGTYSSLTVTLNGCQSSVIPTPSLSDPATPSPPTAGSNSPACDGSSINLNANGQAGAVYSWYRSSGPFVSNDQNPVITGANGTMSDDYCVTQSVANCVSQPSCVTVVVTACGYVWTGNGSDHLWTNAGNWNTTVPPNSCLSNVTIPLVSNYPVLSANVNVGNVQLDDGATLDLAGNTFNTCGDWTGGTNTLSSVVGAGSVTLSGSTAQLISGKTLFQTLRLNNSAGVTMSSTSAVDIYTALELQNGVFHTGSGGNNGILTFKSTSPTQAAVLDNFSSGMSGTFDISGSVGIVKVERAYVATSANSYNQHFFGSSVDGPALSQFGTNSLSSGPVTPTNNCDETQLQSGSLYGSVMSYNQNNVTACSLAGWYVEAATSLAVNGKGYTVAKTGAGVLTLTGKPNLNTSGYPQTNLSNGGWQHTSLQGRQMRSGWQLVSNPYIAELDIANITVDPSMMSQVQVWNAQSGSYVSYIMNDPLYPHIYIAPGQAFFVRKSGTGGGGTFNIPGNARRRNTGVPFYQQQLSEHLFLNAVNQNTGLEDNTVIGFAANATDQFDDRFDANKIAGSLTRHTLYSVNNGTWMSVNTLNSIAQTSTVDVGFEPGINGSYTLQFNGLGSFDPTSYITLEDKNLNIFYDVRNGSYDFTSDATDDWNRFVLHFTPAVQIATTNQDCNNAGSITAIQPGAASWNYTLTTLTNDTLESGILNDSSSINLNVDAGTYILTLTDNNNYTVVKTIAVSGTQPVTAGFTSSATAVETSVDITFNSTTANATNYYWDFGDGTTGTGQTYSHSYGDTGTYTVTLIVISNDGCSSTASQIITVTQTIAGIATTILNQQTINIWSFDNRVYVDFGRQTKVDAAIEIYNLLGQEMVNEKFAKNPLYSKAFNNLDATYVIVKARNEGQIKVKRVFITGR